jgi:hypothetical protein
MSKMVTKSFRIMILWGRGLEGLEFFWVVSNGGSFCFMQGEGYTCNNALVFASILIFHMQ